MGITYHEYISIFVWPEGVFTMNMSAAPPPFFTLSKAVTIGQWCIICGLWLMEHIIPR